MTGFRTQVKRVLGRNSLILLEIYYAIRYAFGNAGGQYECSCCGSRPRRFLPAALGSQGMVAAMRCPRCDSHPRHRLLWLFLRECTPQLFAAPRRLLHIAPEFCLQRRFRRLPNLRYITGDLASPLADSRFDLTALPFAAATFDAVLCSHVLEHVPDDRAAMRELFRVLAPGGWGLLQVPVEAGRAETYEDPLVTAPRERARLFGQDDHVRQYGNDYPDRLRAAGFEVQVIDYLQRFDDAQRRRYGLLPGEAIFFCTKAGCGDGREVG